jgi:hypothetical protein
MLSTIMLSWHHAECHHAECHYAECHYAECRGAILLLKKKLFLSFKLNKTHEGLG